MKRLNINTSIESLLVMILMVIFAFSTIFIIVEGKSAFERVTDNKIEDENARIALSYVNKRIKQDDRSDSINLIEDAVAGQDALKIDHGDGLSTYIYSFEGIMYECYTDTVPTFELSTEIVPVNHLSFKIEDRTVHMSLTYEYHGKNIQVTQKTHLRSEEERHE
jgi:hypothetical protein